MLTAHLFSRHQVWQESQTLACLDRKATTQTLNKDDNERYRNRMKKNVRTLTQTFPAMLASVTKATTVDGAM